MKKDTTNSDASGCIELLEKIPEMVGGVVGMRTVLSSQLDAALADKGKWL